VALLRLSFTPRKQLSGGYFLAFPSPSTGFRATHTTTPFLAGEDGLGKSKYCIGSYTSAENNLEEREKKEKVKPRSVHRLESTTTITETRNKSHDSDRKGRRINISSQLGERFFF